MKGILYTYQVLGSPYNVRGDTAGCDLIEGDDGVPSPQLSLLDQFLPCHLCVHNHVVQLSNTKQINNSVQTQTHREGERMNISVTILNSHLSTSRNFQSCCHFDIFDLYEFTHKAMDFTSIKIFLRVFVVKLKLRKSKRKVSFTLI